MLVTEGKSIGIFTLVNEVKYIRILMLVTENKSIAIFMLVTDRPTDLVEEAPSRSLKRYQRSDQPFRSYQLF